VLVCPNDAFAGTRKDNTRIIEKARKNGNNEKQMFFAQRQKRPFMFGLHLKAFVIKNNGGAPFNSLSSFLLQIILI
jgi:hypothetical protein